MTKARHNLKSAQFQDTQQDSQLEKPDRHQGRKWAYTGKLKDQVNDGAKPAGGEHLPVAERRDDHSPAIHGWVRRQPKVKVPRGTAENVVAVRKHLSSRTGLGTMAGIESQP